MTLTFHEMCAEAKKLAVRDNRVAYVYETPSGTLLATTVHWGKDWLFRVYPGGRSQLSKKGKEYVKSGS